MTPEQFKEAKEKLGLSYSQIGKILDVNPRSVRRWTSGEMKVPGPVAFSMQAMLNGYKSPEK